MVIPALLYLSAPQDKRSVAKGSSSAASQKPRGQISLTGYTSRGSVFVANPDRQYRENLGRFVMGYGLGQKEPRLPASTKLETCGHLRGFEPRPPLAADKRAAHISERAAPLRGEGRRPESSLPCRLSSPRSPESFTIATRRRGGRAVECTGLENRQGGDTFEGSNPSLSAK